MKNLTVKELKKVQNFQDLEGLGIGQVYCDIGGRGGGVGFYSQDVANAFGVSDCDLPNKFGAGCNYLGGGVRGSIFGSTFNEKNIVGKKAELLSALAQACVRVYENIENESGMNSDGEDGETNWDAQATKASRKAGIKSAY